VDRRDFNDPKYKAWRRRVYARDKFKCRMPDCPGGDKRMNAHHIRKWATHPSLRFVTDNGVTLCRTCHERIRGLEENYESLFSGLVSRPKSDFAIQLLMMKYGPKPEEAE